MSETSAEGASLSLDGVGGTLTLRVNGEDRTFRFPTITDAIIRNSAGAEAADDLALGEKVAALTQRLDDLTQEFRAYVAERQAESQSFVDDLVQSEANMLKIARDARGRLAEAGPKLQVSWDKCSEGEPAASSGAGTSAVPDTPDRTFLPTHSPFRVNSDKDFDLARRQLRRRGIQRFTPDQLFDAVNEVNAASQDVGIELFWDAAKFFCAEDASIEEIRDMALALHRHGLAERAAHQLKEIKVL